MSPKPVSVKTQTIELKAVGGPHNGSSDEYRFPDPVTGAMIGGQVAYVRCALRHKRFVAPWGRRAGKTTGRPFLWNDEASMTKGRYTAAFITVNHVKAWEAYQFCLMQFGGMVTVKVGEPESQNRYIELGPINWTAERVPRAYAECPIIGPRIRANLGKNTGARIYFLSGQYPTVTAVQGFPFPFDRISLDEAQQIHPGVTKIVNPMLMDSGGALDVSGIADVEEMGNDWFSDYFDRGNDPARRPRWFSLNFPTYCNPNLDLEAVAEVEADLLTQDDYEQYILAKFLSAAGSVFKNLDAVFTLKPRWTRTLPAHSDLPPWALALLTRARSDSLLMWIVDDEPKAGHSYAITVDFAGRTKTRDATAISVFDMTENRQVCLVSIRDMTPPDQLKWIDGLKTQYRCEELHGDETPEGAALMAYLRERHGAGIRGHNFSSHNKGLYVKRAQFLFEMAEVALIDCDYQRKEFKDFRRIASESKAGVDGPVSYSHPPNKHDDTVAAFLQIAPSMAHGRREFQKTEEAKSSIDQKTGAVTMDFFSGEDGASPFREEREDSEPSLDDMVFPR